MIHNQLWMNSPRCVKQIWGTRTLTQLLRNIISIVRTSLDNLIMAIEGTVVMTVDLLEDSNCVFDPWMQHTYDIQHRCAVDSKVFMLHFFVEQFPQSLKKPGRGTKIDDVNSIFSWCKTLKPHFHWHFSTLALSPWASMSEILRMGECQRSGHMMLLVLKSHGCYLQLVAGALGWLIGRDKCQSGFEKMEIIHRSLRDGGSFRFPWCRDACILVMTYRYTDLCVYLSFITYLLRNYHVLHDWEQVLTFRHYAVMVLGVGWTALTNRALRFALCFIALQVQPIDLVAGA